MSWYGGLHYYPHERPVGLHRMSYRSRIADTSGQGQKPSQAVLAGSVASDPVGHYSFGITWHGGCDLRRQEVQTWKKVIRVISHELNHSLPQLHHSRIRAASYCVAGSKSSGQLALRNRDRGGLCVRLALPL